MNPKEVLIELGFERKTDLDKEVFNEYVLECKYVSFRAHPVLCNKPDYITCGIVSEDNTKVKAWYDFNSKESLQSFILRNDLQSKIENTVPYEVFYNARSFGKNNSITKTNS